jgi:hypothetical protein
MRLDTSKDSIEDESSSSEDDVSADEEKIVPSDKNRKCKFGKCDNCFL